MKQCHRLAYLVIVVILSWGCESIFSPTSPTVPPVDSETVASPKGFSVAEVILETNNQRKRNGLEFLSENPKLNAAANYKMRDMFSRQYFGHYAPDGTSGLAEILTRFNYQYRMAGENLAIGNFKNSAELVTLWMASPGHKENILKSNYAEIGIAVGENLFDGRQTKIAVQVFGTPR